MSYKLNNISDKIIISLLRNAIIIVDNSGRVIFWNEAATRILLYTAAEALGADLDELIAPQQYKGKYKQVFGAFRATDEDARINNTVELLAIRKDQVEITVELSLSSVVIGDKWCAVCMLLDISARKQTEQDLWRTNEQLETRVAELTRELYTIKVNKELHWAVREEDQEIEVCQQVQHELLADIEKLQRFFSLARDLLCFIDKRGNFCRVNRAFELTLGYSADEMMSRPFVDFVHPDDVQETKDKFASVLGGQVIIGFCNRYLCKEGNYCWLEWTVFIDEKTSICYGVARDSTNRKLAEEELREKNKEVILARRKAEESWRHLNNVLQNVDAVIWQLDKNGVYTLYEGQMLKKMACKPGQNVGLSIFKLYKDHPEILKAMKRSLKGKPSKFEAQYQNMIMSVICTSLLDSDGNVNGVVGITLDITERRDWERRLKFIQESHRRSADFNDILTKRYSEEEQNRRLGNYGIDARKPVTCYLLTVTPRNMAMEDLEISKEDVMEWLVKNGYVWNWYSCHGIGVLIQNRGDVSGVEYDQKSGAQALKANIETHFPEILVRIGVASIASGILNLTQLYYKSYAALLLSMDKEDSGVCHYNGSGIYQMLPFMMEHMNIDDFVNQFLGGIIEYEKDKGGELLSTLGAILACPNLKTVAIELHVHHNTVLWRKNKIETILGYTIDDTNRRINLAVAIKLQKIRKVMEREL